MMAAGIKKVILLIVDGPTDEAALSPVLKKMFQRSQVRFHVVHGDLTSERHVDADNAVSTINMHIKREMDRYGFRRSDILRVVHLIDTDGAFIPNEDVVEGEVERLRYEENQIISRHPDITIRRNERKAQVLNRLCSAKTVGGSPYTVYYFSRNMEHVLHGSIEDLSDAQKADRADAFADLYDDAPERFAQFLENSDFTVRGDYQETWNFIFDGTNSLHRHCNLHLLFSGGNEAGS